MAVLESLLHKVLTAKATAVRWLRLNMHLIHPLLALLRELQYTGIFLLYVK